MKTKIAKIMKRYRGENELTQMQFADAINAVIPGSEFVRQNVSQWENGEVRPSYFFMLLLYMKDEGWAGKMALEILKEMRPELYK